MCFCASVTSSSGEINPISSVFSNVTCESMPSYRDKKGRAPYLRHFVLLSLKAKLFFFFWTGNERFYLGSILEILNSFKYVN